MKTIGSDTIKTSTVHAFEARGLGKAPYTFLGVQVMVGPITMKDGSQLGAPGQPMGTCHFCSTGLKNAFMLRSADNKEFYVGCECIRKSGDKGLLRVVSIEEKKKRQAKAEVRRQKEYEKALEMRDEVMGLLASSDVQAKLGAKPHPVIPGMTLFNYVEFLVDRARCFTRAHGIITKEMGGN